MASAQPSNTRASLLSGLRTGGVRSASNPVVPHTAAPGGSFNVPRLASASNHLSHFPEEVDHLGDMMQQNLYVNQGMNRFQGPMTAAVDGAGFAQQQGGYGGMPFNQGYGMGNNMQAQAQAQAQLQMQMMQMEMLRLQTLQAQQYQAELMRQQSNQGPRRGTFNPPATAGPINTSFDLRSAALHSQMRANAAADDQVPMTAALGGRFGSRSGGRTSPDEDDMPPPTPTRVISGGTSLGAPTSAPVVVAAPTKSESATSWRRGGNNNSVLKGRLSSLSSSDAAAKASPSTTERVSPPPTLRAKGVPQPLNFSAPTRVSIPAVAIIDENGELDDSSSNSSSDSAKSSPITSTSSCGDQPPLSPREEASKKLYEGLGLGRPAPAPAPLAKVFSVPSRQPRGPPLADELGTKNFAARLRRKAVDGLGALVAARERREVEAF